MRVAFPLLVTRLALACVMPALSGCLIIPHKAKLMSGVIIPEKATKPFVVGESTRVDVLHQLGQPDFIEQDGRVFAYRWTMTSLGWILIAASPNGAGAVAGGDIPTDQYLVLIEFDDNGLLRRLERVHPDGLPGNPGKTIHAWIDKDQGTSEEQKAPP